MPVALAAVEIYSGWTAATAVGVTVFGEVAAGAMIAGGAMTIVGAATGNKNLENTGSTIGAIGSIGSMANAAMFSSTTVPADVTTAQASELANSGNPNAVSSSLSGAKDAAGNVLSVSGQPVVTPTINAAGNASAGGATDLATTNAANIKALADAQQGMQKYSMVTGALQGAGTAYTGWAQSQSQKEIAAQQQRFQQGLADRANSVGQVGIAPANLLAVGGGSSPAVPIVSPAVAPAVPQPPAPLKV